MADSRSKVLFLLNCEYGQANVVMAVVHEMIMRGNVDINVGSFASLEARVMDLYERDINLYQGDESSKSTFTFHTIKGEGMLESIGRRLGVQSMATPPGMWGALEAIPKIPEWLFTWEPHQYIEGYESCLEIIKNVKPDVVVTENLLGQAIDACRTLGLQWIILSPNTFRDLIIQEQAAWKQFFKYPLIATGYPYPLSWWHTLLTFCLRIRTIISFMSSSRTRKMIKARSDHGIKGDPPIFFPYDSRAWYMTPSIPESDFDGFIIPKNVTSCGPILMASSPVSESDPDLASWLGKAPTVLVNLGTHYRASFSAAHEFAVALRILLQRNSKVQVLWKLELASGDQDAVVQVLEREMATDRVRIVSWLNADPVAVLRSGNVVCWANHGGSNSFHEALSAGVAQIVLPNWSDTYQHAVCAEWLGIGVYANKKAGPGIDADELSKAFLRIVGDDEHPEGDELMKEKTKRLAETANGHGGRATACEKIVELARQGGKW